MKIDSDFANRVLSYALSHGAEYADVYIINSNAIASEARGKELEALEQAIVSGFAVRTFKDKKQGFSYSTDFAKWQEVVLDAVQSMKWTEDDEFYSIPESAQYEVCDIFDKQVATISQADAINMAIELEAAAFDTDKRVTKIRKAAASFSRYEVCIANTMGLYGCYSATSWALHITAVAEHGGEAQAGYGYEAGRFLQDAGPKRVGQEAALRAISLLGSKKAKTVKAAVIFENHIVCELMGLLASALSSENVQKGKSLFMNKHGEVVISEKLSVLDDAKLRRGLGSRPFDAEGVPSMCTTLIDNGRLVNFLYNTYTAKKAGGLSTANAVRGGISSTIGVGISNLYLSPNGISNCSKEELFAQVSDGFFVTDVMGMHTANPYSGDFSIGANGIWISDGALSHPVKEAVITGNVLEVLKNVEGVGDDLKFYGRIGSPSLLIACMDISG